MASTVIGLFERQTDAEAAFNDLIENGFSRSDIDLMAAGNGTKSDSLMSELENEGVPAADARLYAEGMRAGDALEIVHSRDDNATVARDIMNRHGALDIHDAFTQRGNVLPATGVGLTDTGAVLPPMSSHATAPRKVTLAAVDAQAVNAQNETTIPIVEEELTVGKREIQRGGARVHTTVTERPVQEQITLREEHVMIERHAVDRPVANADLAFQEQSFEVTETAEVPVVAKTARVVEEVIVGKEATERTETIHDTIRRTDVDVEEVLGVTPATS